jgi:integrase/recombinase XerD
MSFSFHKIDKNMPTVKIIQRTDKTRHDGTAPLFIRLTHRRKSRYRSLRVRILPEHWDQPRQRVQKAHPFSTRLNALLAQKRAEFERLAIELQEKRGNLYRTGLGELLEGPAGRSFLDYSFSYVDDLIREGRHGTARNYQSTFQQFATWLRDHKRMPDLSFAQFSVTLASEFKSYLDRELSLHPNSVKVKFAALRRVMNLAQREGIISESQNTLKRIETPGRKTQKAIPTAGEMAQIEAVELKPGSRLWHSRNLYLFSARMAGLRFSDAVTLRWGQVQGERLHWTTKKTRKSMQLFIPPAARAILDQYRDESRHDDFVFPSCPAGTKKSTSNSAGSMSG